MSEQLGDYATRVVSEEKPLTAWACCDPDKRELSEHKPGDPLGPIEGYLPPQVMPWRPEFLRQSRKPVLNCRRH
jgi:hypothetical protein